MIFPIGRSFHVRCTHHRLRRHRRGRRLRAVQIPAQGGHCGAGERRGPGHHQGQLRHPPRRVRPGAGDADGPPQRPGGGAGPGAVPEAGRALPPLRLPGAGLLGGGAARPGGAVPEGPGQRRARPEAAGRGGGPLPGAEPVRRGGSRPPRPLRRHLLPLGVLPCPGGDGGEKRRGAALEHRRHRAGTAPGGGGRPLMAGPHKPGGL